MRALPDRVDRGPVRRGRPAGLPETRRRRRRPRPGHRRRPARHLCRRGSPRRLTAQNGQRRPHQGQPGRHGQQGEGRLRRSPARWLWRDRLRALRRDGGRFDRSSRDRMGRGTAEGRLVLPIGTHGEMERGPAHRGGARIESALRRPRRLAECTRAASQLRNQADDEHYRDRHWPLAAPRRRRKRRSRLQGHPVCRPARRTTALAGAPACAAVVRRAEDGCFRSEFPPGSRFRRHRPLRLRRFGGLSLSERLDSRFAAQHGVPAGHGLDSMAADLSSARAPNRATTEAGSPRVALSS